MVSSTSSACQYSCIMISLPVLILLLAPLTVVYLADAEPGISTLYRRALTSSESKNSKHPMVTLVDDSDDLAAQGLHSHDNKTSNSTEVPAATKELNNTASNVIQAQPPLTSDAILANDIHAASAQIVKDWGLGWDTKVERIVQVLIGLSIYFVVMIVKGFLISWGVGQVQNQINDVVSHAGNSDMLANLVNSAVDKIF